MKLKVDDQGHAVLQDGKPVYVHDDGKEVAFDAPATVATISRLNAEAKSHREAKEAAEQKLKSYEGITDPASALKALETVKNLKDKQLVEAGQVETVRAEAIKATEEKFAPVVKENESLKAELRAEKIGGSFVRSKFIAEKIAIPADIMEAKFGQNFDIKDGKVVAKDHAGNQVFSRSKPGELADFDEALELLVDAYPQKDNILKAKNKQGDPAKHTDKSLNGGGKTLRRSDFDALPLAQRQAKIAEGYTLTD